MAKPTELPRWGTDETNEVTPSEGQRDSGWVTNQTHVSSYENWLNRTTYDWTAWLDDVFADDDTTLTVSRDVSVDGDLDADNVTAGEVYHGDRKLILSPQTARDAQLDSEAGSISAEKIVLIGTTDTDEHGVDFPITLRAGDRIRSVLFFVKDNTSGLTVDGNLYRVPRNGSETSLANASTSSAAAEVTMASIDHTVLEDSSYVLRAQVTGNGGLPDTSVSYAEITYDRP
jgi:hypothetical protein